jgi:hypothetical protein
MAYSFNGSNQYLSTASSPVGGPPLTIAAWMRTTAVSAPARVVGVGVSGGTHRNQLGLTTQFAQVQAVSVGPSTVSASNFEGPGVVANVLIHGCAVFQSRSNRLAYMNGIAGAQDFTDVGIQNTANTITVGAGWATTIGIYLAGDVAEVGVWNVALTAQEISSLSKGFACNLIRPQSLVFYAPLVRDLIDFAGGRVITNNNTATVSNHPRIYLS